MRLRYTHGETVMVRYRQGKPWVAAVFMEYAECTGYTVRVRSPRRKHSAGVVLNHRNVRHPDDMVKEALLE